MSAPAVTERAQRLERAGVIAGYQLQLNPIALGLPVSAFVRVRPVPGQLQEIAELVKRLPQVSECTGTQHALLAGQLFQHRCELLHEGGVDGEVGDAQLRSSAQQFIGHLPGAAGQYRE
jgi:DNA-binding Lrp family transcriptional regulator